MPNPIATHAGLCYTGVMARSRRESLIRSDPRVCHGKPCFKGTRIAVSTVLELLEAGQSPADIKRGYPAITARHVRAALHLAAEALDSVAVLSARIVREGDDSWMQRLFEFTDSFRRAPTAGLQDSPPDARLSPRLKALWASAVEALCEEKRLPAPCWCAGIPGLAEPWFVSGLESLKASALAESPVWFRRRNIFVLGNFLARA